MVFILICLRFSRNIPFNHSTKSRVTSYAQNVQLHTEDMMGASRYLPPLFRTLARLISKHAWLYTEMLAAETIVYQQGNLLQTWHWGILNRKPLDKIRTPINMERKQWKS
ncbi:hypothetical protein V6Z11_D13G125700 [Gossypium hirsutum]